MTRLKLAVASWILALAVVTGVTVYRGDTLPKASKVEALAPSPVAPQQLQEVVACKAQEDAERLAVAFNKTNDLAHALEDPKSEAAAVSRRMLIEGRCAHFEHHITFAPVAMPFDGMTFVPALAKPFNVVEADVALIGSSGRYFLVTEWRPEAGGMLAPPKAPLTPS